MTTPEAGSPLRQRMIDDMVARKLVPERHAAQAGAHPIGRGVCGLGEGGDQAEEIVGGAHVVRVSLARLVCAQPSHPASSSSLPP
jgi:hypothetical protein